MGSISEAEEWEACARTGVSEAPGWRAIGFEEGIAEGRLFGPQCYWKTVAYLRHSELGDGERMAFISAFMDGVKLGIDQYRAERLAYGFEERMDEPPPTLRCSPVPVAPVADQEQTERHSLTRVKAPPLPARKAK